MKKLPADRRHPTDLPAVRVRRVNSPGPSPTGGTMNTAALQARVKRLTALIDGMSKETAAVLADRGALTLQEWNRYLKALDNAKDALHDARAALQTAAVKR